MLVSKMEINFDKLLTDENFSKFVYKNKKTNKKHLTVNKKTLCAYFNISTPTLLKWMRNNGYDDLISKRKPKPVKRKSLKMVIPPSKQNKANKEKQV